MSDYGDVVAPLHALAETVQTEIVDEVSGHPIYLATIHPQVSRPAIWVNAGTHGDEPATVAAAMRLLESDVGIRFPQTRIDVTPCLNPYGYVLGQRENEEGIDINWAFRQEIPEIALIKRMIEGNRYDAIIDLHEDWESPGYYLYEQCRSGLTLGPEIVERVKRICPINASPVIEGEVAEGGVIHPDLNVPKRSGGDGVPVEVFKRATDHQITSETPTEKPMDVRVNAHLAAVQVFLETYGG